MGRLFFALGSFCLTLFAPAALGMNRENFTNVNHLIIDFYAPQVAKKFGAALELNELWNNFGGAFKVDSAQKILSEPRFIITLTGEIPHNSFINTDAYAIVACHEIGHIIGGAPYQNKKLNWWSSVEGQADYYATNTCMWDFIRKSPGPKAPLLDKQALSLCAIFYGDSLQKEQDCQRIISAILAFADYFNSTKKSGVAISLAHPDISEVSETLERYPSKQCRIDTMIAGLFNLDRPRCWYKA